jgi:ATP-dependent Zn protease
VENFDWMNLFINWFPMLLIFGVWLFFVRQMRGGAYSKYQKDCLDMQRRQTEALERLATALERRAP